MGNFAPLLRQPKPEEESGGGRSIGGFLKNLVGDVSEIAEGVGNIAGAVGHDILFNPLKEAATLGGAETQFYTDDLFKGLTGYQGRSGMLPDFDLDESALAQDYKRRYGSAGGFLRGLYEDPLAFVGDAATVATLGGYSAAKGAQAASKVGSVADDLARLGKAGDVGDVGTVARAVDRILPGAKMRAVGEDVPLGGTRKLLVGTGREEPRLLEASRAFNPARRVMEEGVLERALTKPVGGLRRELDDLDIGLTKDAADKPLLEQTIALANEHGVTRITRPTVAKFKLGGMMRRLMADHSSEHVARRDEWMAPYETHWDAVPDDVKPDFDLRLQGVNPTIGQGYLTFEEITAELGNPAVIETPKGRAIARAAGGHLDRVRQITDPVEAQAARYVVESTIGEPLAGLRRGLEDPTSDAFDAFRLTNFDQEARRLVERWDEKNPKGPYVTLLERSLKPLHYSRTKRWDFDSPEEVFALADEVRASGMKSPVYFPHYETLRLNRSDFLMPWRLFGMRRSAETSTSKLSHGKLFMERMRGTKDAYETDPARAYGRASAEAIKLEETESFISDMTKTLGRQVEALSDVGTGERVINLDGSRARIRRRLESELVMADALEAGKSVEDALAEGIGHALRAPDEALAAEIAGRGNLWAVPKSAADKIEAVAKSRIGGSSAALRLFYEGPINLWRDSVLYYRPGFYVYNVYGNQAFLMLQGGRTSGVLRQASKRYRRDVNRILEQAPPDIRDQVLQGFHSRTVQRTPHLGAAEDTLLGRGVKAVKESPVGRTGRRTTDTLRSFNLGAERIYRRESFLTGLEEVASKRGVKLAGTSFFRSKKRLEQLMELGAEPKFAREALNAVDKALNNYRALGPWERNVMVRLLFPFWPFYKHAARTLITMPYQHPIKAALLDKIAQVDDEMRERLGPVPEWLETALPIGPGAEPGTTSFATTRGANPFSDVADRIDEGLGGVAETAVSLANPLLKGVVELGTGRSSFTGKQFTSPDAYRPFGSEQQYDIDTGEPVTVRPYGDYLLNLFPQARLAGDVLGGGARYSTGEVITDPQTGEPRFPTDPFQEILGFLGYPTVDFDVGAYQERLRGDLEAVARERARRGLAP